MTQIFYFKKNKKTPPVSAAVFRPDVLFFRPLGKGVTKTFAYAVSLQGNSNAKTQPPQRKKHLEPHKLPSLLRQGWGEAKKPARVSRLGLAVINLNSY